MSTQAHTYLYMPMSATTSPLYVHCYYSDIATVTLEVSMLKGTVAYVIPATDPGNDLTSLGVSLSQTIAGDASTSTFVGTPSGVNFVCSNLHYTNSIDHDTSSDTLSVSISYAQSDGLGAGTITGSKDITLAVTAVNDSPVVSLPTDLQVTNGTV